MTILLSFLTILVDNSIHMLFRLHFFKQFHSLYTVSYRHALFVRFKKGLNVSSDSTQCCSSIKVWNNSAELHKVHVFDKRIWNSSLHDYPLYIFKGLIYCPDIFLWLFYVAPFRLFFFTEIYNLIVEITAIEKCLKC